MGLLQGLNPVKPIEPCKVGRTIIELDSDDAQILLDALTDSRWTARALSKALSERGITLAKDTIDSHMKKVCRCSKI